MVKVALLIGVSEYQSGLESLPSAVKDIEAMQRVLLHPEIGRFDEVKPLINPIRQEMEEAIYELFTNRQQDDLLLFYFSGHGVQDQSFRLFLTTSITRKDKSNCVIPPTAVAASYLQEQMTNSRSKRQVIILDCCYSGAFAKGLTVKNDGQVNIQTDLGGKGRAILTSSSSAQYSFCSKDSELSNYTHYLVEGIETGSADLDGDGWISIEELHQYTSSKVQQTSSGMNPKFYPVEEGYKIILARSPKTQKLTYGEKLEIVFPKFETPSQKDMTVKALMRYYLEGSKIANVKSAYGNPGGETNIYPETVGGDGYSQKVKARVWGELKGEPAILLQLPVERNYVLSSDTYSDICELLSRDLSDYEIMQAHTLSGGYPGGQIYIKVEGQPTMTAVAWYEIPPGNVKLFQINGKKYAISPKACKTTSIKIHQRKTGSFLYEDPRREIVWHYFDLYEPDCHLPLKRH